MKITLTRIDRDPASRQNPGPGQNREIYRDSDRYSSI